MIDGDHSHAAVHRDTDEGVEVHFPVTEEEVGGGHDVTTGLDFFVVRIPEVEVPGQRQESTRGDRHVGAQFPRLRVPVSPDAHVLDVGRIRRHPEMGAIDRIEHVLDASRGAEAAEAVFRLAGQGHAHFVMDQLGPFAEGRGDLIRRRPEVVPRFPLLKRRTRVGAEGEGLPRDGDEQTHPGELLHHRDGRSELGQPAGRIGPYRLVAIPHPWGQLELHSGVGTAS